MFHFGLFLFFFCCSVFVLAGAVFVAPLSVCFLPPSMSYAWGGGS